MSNKGKYKIPKARVVGPILVHSLIFLIVIGLIIAVLGVLSDYVKDVRSEADKEYVESVARMYDSGTKADQANSLSKLELDGHDYCIIDKNGNVIQSHGDITVEGYIASNNGFAEQTIQEMLSDLGLDEEIPGEIKVTILGSGQDSSFIIEDKDSSKVAFSEATKMAFNDPDALFKSSNSVFKFPYWVGTSISEGDEILLVKADLVVKVKDYTYLAGGVLIALFIALVVFTLMIIGVIRNLNANRRMRNLLYRDEIAKGRNWLWYAIKCQEILYKKRNANKTYAVVELVFIKFRNFVLCHSVKEAEDLLKEVVRIISSKLGKQELCAHSNSSGLPLLLEVKDEDDARERLQGIINELEKISKSHKLAFRAGVYLVTPAQEKIIHKQKRYIPDIDLLYNNACTAGLSVADVGDSSIVFFDNNLVEEEKWIDKVTDRQYKAVENEEFLVYYQPKYSPKTDELMGAEALIRWQTKDMGLVPPYKFIPIFEDNGFITEIDHYMITHVARDQKKWLDEGRKCVPVSVNVSRAHFVESNLAEQICQMVDGAGCPRNLLEIELTESAFFDDENAMIDTINKLKAYGFLVSMDDFGSGYSSLNSLKDMPLDILKLDAGFFRGSEDNPRTEIVVSEAIRLAKSLNMMTVAEGVEEKSTVDFLAKEGCDMIQGYYYSKPMPREEYEANVIKVPGAQAAENTPEAAPVEQTVVSESAPVETPAEAPSAPVETAAPVAPQNEAPQISETNGETNG